MILPPDEVSFAITKRMKEITYTKDDGDALCDFALALVRFRLLKVRKNYHPLRIGWRGGIFVDNGTGFQPVQT